MKTTSLREHCVLPTQILAAGKFCLLSKEPLEYQKSSTRFRFSFQKLDEEIYTNGEPKLLNKETNLSSKYGNGAECASKTSDAKAA